MALKTMVDRLNKARDEYQKQLASLGKDAQEAIAKAISECLPPDKQLMWAQYTPYFNDGEPCVFRVNDGYLQELGSKQKPYEGEYKLPADLKTVLKSIPTDMLQNAFGDHIKVVVRPDGTYDVNEHDHD